MLGNIFSNFSLASIPQTISANAAAFVAMLAAYLLHAIPSGTIPRLDRLCIASRLPGQAALIAIAIWAVLQCEAAFFSEAASALPIYANF